MNHAICIAPGLHTTATKFACASGINRSLTFFRSRSRLFSVITFQPNLNNSSALERPIPIVFFAGEGLHPTIWNQASSFLSSCGYRGLCLEYPSNSQSVEDAVSYLRQNLLDFKSAPPVLVAHSFSSYIAQKYLESYALSGLVLVNPVPPHPSNTIIHLFDRWIDSVGTKSHGQYCDASVGGSKKTSEHFISSALRRYYGFPEASNEGKEGWHILLKLELSNSLCDKITAWSASSYSDKRLSFPVSVDILRQLVYQTAPQSSDPDQYGVESMSAGLHSIEGASGGDHRRGSVVLLEPGVVPTMIMTSDGDHAVLSRLGREALTLLHRVPDEFNVHFPPIEIAPKNFSKSPSVAKPSYSETQLNSNDRLPMLTNPDNFNHQLLRWIEIFT